MSEKVDSSDGESGPAAAPCDPQVWLRYYSECRQYELVLGQKFIGLLGQASVFSFTAAVAIFTLADRLGVRSPQNLWVAIPAVAGLFMYGVIIAKYFFQIRYTGGIMEEIEKRILGREAANLGLIHVLRNPKTAFYGRPWTPWLVGLYATMLITLPIAAVLAVW